MNDPENPYFVSGYFEDHPIIPDAKLPITMECFPQGRTIELRLRSKSRFNGFLDALFYFRIKQRNIR